MDWVLCNLQRSLLSVYSAVAGKVGALMTWSSLGGLGVSFGVLVIL